MELKSFIQSFHNDNSHLIEHILQAYTIIESITPDTIHLKNFINDDKSKIKNMVTKTYYYIEDFLKKPIGKKYNISELNDMDEDYEKVEYLSNKFDTFDEDYYNYIAIHNYEDTEFYSSTESNFDNAKYFRNQWCVHFTDNGYDIISEGFKRGVPVYELDKLGITDGRQNRNLNFDTSEGLYIFAFLANERFRDFKYGKQAVMFKASGVRAYHNGDEEHQCIVDTKSIQDIILIEENNNGDYFIDSKDNRPLVTKEHFKDIVKWVVNHYEQYKNVIFKKSVN